MEYVYSLPTVSQPGLVPSLTLRSCSGSSCSSGLLSWRQTEYDGLGRPRFERIEYPGGGGGAIQESMKKTYDAQGRLVSETVWGDEGKATVFSGYDRFGRVGTITLPDGKETSFAYLGDRVVTRGVEVATSPSDSTVFTSETRDGFGRLTSVCEGKADAMDPAGCPAPAVRTSYTYDLADRLTKVCGDSNATGSSCTQQRLFGYDQRGFLMSETHPEVGPSGKGETTYTYDAAGNVRSRDLVGTGDFALRYRYDGAGRLIFVDEVTGSSSTRRLKEFTYARANDGDDKRKGKLVQAKRYNWVDIVAPLDAPTGSLPVVIRDRCVYEGRSGRSSLRRPPSTAARPCATLDQ